VPGRRPAGRSDGGAGYGLVTAYSSSNSNSLSQDGCRRNMQPHSASRAVGSASSTSVRRRRSAHYRPDGRTDGAKRRAAAGTGQAAGDHRCAVAINNEAFAGRRGAERPRSALFWPLGRSRLLCHRRRCAAACITLDISKKPDAAAASTSPSHFGRSCFTCA